MGKREEPRLSFQTKMPRIDKIDRRTDVVFILFHYAESIRGVTRLQKLLFLVEKETSFFGEYGEDLQFGFYAHKMGPFSENVYEELRFLKQLQAIETEPLSGKNSETEFTDKKLFLTPKGEKIAIELARLLESSYNEELESIVERYNQMTLQDLLRYVYTEYPEYTTESEIREDVLQTSS